MPDLERRNAEILDALLAFLSEQYVEEISRITAAAVIHGKPARIWFEGETETIHFDVID